MSVPGLNSILAQVVPLKLSFFDDAESATNQITIPSGVIANKDFALFLDSATNDNSTFPTLVSPSGWTLLYNETANLGGSFRIRYAGFYRILDGGGTITGMTGTSNNPKLMAVIRGNRNIRTLTPQSTWNTELTNSNPGSQLITVNNEIVPLVVFGFGRGASGGVYTTETPTFDTNINHSDGARHLDLTVYNNNPQNHTVDIGDEGAGNVLTSGFIRAD